MSAIHIRNVPEPTVSALRERAAARGNSMQQELREILESVAAEPVPRQDPAPIKLATAHTSGETTWHREELYDDEGR